MSPTGPLFPTAASSASGANTAWTNPTNAEVSDATYTTSVLSASSTNNLLVSGFGFNIPQSAIIDGIYAEVQRYGSGISTKSVQLQKAGSLAGTAITTGLDSWPSAEAYQGYGGATSLWGATWLYSDINNSGFGVAIAATGTGTAHIDAIRITVYWHTAPTAVFKEYYYKSFDPSGNYLGNLPIPSSDLKFSQDINSAGATNITITIPKSIDTSALPVDDLTDESGNLLTDENSNQLTDEGQAPLFLPYTSTQDALIKNGNLIQIWVISYWHPNGKCIFMGIMENCAATVGGDGEDDTITILVYSDGEDLDNYLVYSPDLVLDQSQTNQNDYIDLGSDAGGGSYITSAGTSFVTGAGVTNISAISVMLSTTNVPQVATLNVYEGVLGALIGQSNITVSALTPTVYQFVFSTPIPVTAGGTYTFIVFGNSPGASNYLVINIYDTRTYTNGYMYAWSGSSYSPSNSQSLYFETFYGTLDTLGTFTSVDPTSGMLVPFLQTYNSQGGIIQFSTSSIQATGLSLTAQFNTSSITEGINEVLTLAPSGFYWYVDQGTDILYFKQTSSTADVTLVKGLHMNSIKMAESIEYIVNSIFFTGGANSADPGYNIYTTDSNTASIAKYRRRLDRPTDSNVIDVPTAHSVSQEEIATHQAPQNQSVISVLDSAIDIYSLHVGQLVGFAGFGNWVDNVLAQITRIDFTAETATLTLGTKPKKLTTTVEQSVRAIVALNTISQATNPASPS